MPKRRISQLRRRSIRLSLEDTLRSVLDEIGASGIGPIEAAILLHPPPVETLAEVQLDRDWWNSVDFAQTDESLTTPKIRISSNGRP